MLVFYKCVYCSSFFTNTFFLSITADFGLAKVKGTDTSKMTSVCGTILYSWYVCCLIILCFLSMCFTDCFLSVSFTTIRLHVYHSAHS